MRYAGVAASESALDPDVVARLVGRKRKTSPLEQPDPRERQVLASQLAEGRSNVGIARELTVTVAAVERHVTSTFDKLGLHQSPDQHRRVLAVLTSPAGLTHAAIPGRPGAVGELGRPG